MSRETSRHWVKLWRKIGRNRQLRRFEPYVRWCYVILLTMTGDENGTIAEDGELFTVEEIADRARLEVKEVEEAINLLEKHQFIERDQSGEGWLVTNFYQFQVSRDAHRKRVQRHLVDNSGDNVDVKSQDKKNDKSQDESRSTRTDEEAEAEAEAEVEAEAEKKTPPKVPRKRFTKPTAEEVDEYLAEKEETRFDGARFIDGNEQKGWMVGKSPMKDWKAAVRTWIRVRDDDNVPQHRPQHAGAAPDANGEWLYECYRREDMNNFGNHSMWDAYVTASADFAERQAPPFEDWLHGQMEG